MIVCHCHGLTDRQIETAAARCGARSADELAAHCPAGHCCGGCAPVVDEIVRRCEAAAPVDRRSEPRGAA